MLGTIPSTVIEAAKASYAATVAAGNPLTQNQLITRFGLTRSQASKVRHSALAQANGNGAIYDPNATPPDALPGAPA